MKIELHVNGEQQIWLKPETPTEAALLGEMLAGAEKGKRVTLTAKPSYPQKEDSLHWVIAAVEK
jgi:hypothetical protein